MRCDRLNFDTLIIQYNAAIRKMQRLQDLLTDGRTHRGIGDSRRLDVFWQKCTFLHKLQAWFTTMEKDVLAQDFTWLTFYIRESVLNAEQCRDEKSAVHQWAVCQPLSEVSNGAMHPVTSLTHSTLSRSTLKVTLVLN